MTAVSEHLPDTATARLEAFESAEGALDHPAPWNHLAALDARPALDDFVADAGAGAVVNGFGAIAGRPLVGSRECRGDAGDQVHADNDVKNARRGDPDS